jgi:hypothetical protein
VFVAAACGRHRVTPPPDLPAVGAQVSLVRFPSAGGRVEAYPPDSLGTPTWTTQTPVPPIRDVLGADLDERIIWAVDTEGNLIGVDLESRAARKQSAGVQEAVLGPDGSLYLADGEHRIVRILRRNPVPFHDPLPAPPRALFGAGNDQLVAVTAGTPIRLVTENAEQALHTAVLPPGDVAATFWGDLVAVAADTAVVLFETTGNRKIASFPSRHHARRVAFSPSGHRLYVAGDDAAILVYDRFSLSQIARIPLPAPPRDLRVVASGRWMLARPPAADSVWVLDLATNKLAASVPGAWGPNLPLMAGAATLIVRRDDDVVSYDLRQAPPRLVASMPGTASDLWLAAAWVPRERVSAAAAAAESATVAQDSALVPDSTRSPRDSVGIYLQVSTSQNRDWASELAKQLKTAGFPAKLLDPKSPDDGYRVVVGPYATREIAEENGRKLGRAYFILREPVKSP